MKKFFLFVAAAVMAVNVMADEPLDLGTISVSKVVAFSNEGEDGFSFMSADYMLNVALFTEFMGEGTYVIDAERMDNVSYYDELSGNYFTAVSGNVVIEEIEYGYSVKVEADAVDNPWGEPEVIAHFSFDLTYQNLPIAGEMYNATIDVYTDFNDPSIKYYRYMVSNKKYSATLLFKEPIAAGKYGATAFAEGTHVRDITWDASYNLTETTQVDVTVVDGDTIVVISGKCESWGGEVKDVDLHIHSVLPEAVTSLNLGDDLFGQIDVENFPSTYTVETYFMAMNEGDPEGNLKIAITSPDDEFVGEFSAFDLAIGTDWDQTEFAVLDTETFKMIECEVVDGSAVVKADTVDGVAYLVVEVELLAEVKNLWTTVTATITVEAPKGAEPLEGDNSMFGFEDEFEGASITYADGYATISGENEDYVFNLDIFLMGSDALYAGWLNIVEEAPMFGFAPVLLSGKGIVEVEGEQTFGGSYFAPKGEDGMAEAPAWFVTNYEGTEFTTVMVSDGEEDGELVIELTAYNSYGMLISATINAKNVVTGCENVEAAVKAVKAIENGQMIIVRDGEKYNVVGAKL